MTSVASPIKDFSIHSSDTSLRSASSLERQALQYQLDFERLNTPALSKQRVTVTEAQVEEQANLAVCAKIEKAIGRRLSLQDAEFTRKVKIVAPALRKETNAHSSTTRMQQ